MIQMRLKSWCVMLFCFFQAEDGIRDYKVTGVQTCALPICWTFNSEPVVERPAFRFLELKEKVLVACFAFRILYRHLDRVEHAQVIQMALCIQHRRLAQRITGVNIELPGHDPTLGKFQTAEQNTVHEDL